MKRIGLPFAVEKVPVRRAHVNSSATRKVFPPRLDRAAVAHSRVCRVEDHRRWCSHRILQDLRHGPVELDVVTPLNDHYLAAVKQEDGSAAEREGAFWQCVGQPTRKGFIISLVARREE